MNAFLRHEECPNCGSRNNLGVWEDGHKWCFGCGFYIPGYKGMSRQDIRQQLKQKENNKNGNSVYLPNDFSSILPESPLTWLRKYGITDHEILQNKFGWSQNHERLIFPCFDLYGNLVIYQGRYFGNSSETPRYSTRGQVESCYHILGGHSNTIVLVEDVISAIKVARVQQAMPLFGSQISLDRIKKLSDLVPKLVIWLDADKARYAVQSKMKASPFFDEVACVITLKDPKEYSTREIQAFLENA